MIPSLLNSSGNCMDRQMVRKDGPGIGRFFKRSSLGAIPKTILTFSGRCMYADLIVVDAGAVVPKMQYIRDYA